MRALLLLGLALVVAPAALLAAPRGPDRAPAPAAPHALPAFAQRVAPALVGVRVRVPEGRPSTATLGRERWGSGVVVDPEGHVLTVSYVVLDAGPVEVVLHDGRVVPGRVAALDLEAGLGVVRITWPGPWPSAPLGDSTRVDPLTPTATLGMEDNGDLVMTVGRIESVGPFAASWEYMLARAFFVAPANRAFGGAALMDRSGQVIGITSLRLGEPPFVNLAIPMEAFLAGKDELLRRGRVESRRVRPWLGLYTQTLAGVGVVVIGTSPAGPARSAGFQRGDVIVRVAEHAVSSQEEFYARLWEHAVGEDLVLVVRRERRFEAITVRPADRYRTFRVDP